LLATLIAGAYGCAPAVLAQGTEKIEVLRIRPSFYVIAGAGGNIGVQIGADGVVLVDTGTKDASAQVIAEIRKLTAKPIRYIINTSADADHVGGNSDLAKAGQSIYVAEGRQAEFIQAMTGGAASVLAHENVLIRMSAPTGKSSPFPSDAWPTETFAGADKRLYFNHEGIEVLHEPAAHTDGDSLVFFRISDVVMAGNILDTRRFPVINLEEGGSIQGEIDALNHLIKLAIPPGPFVFQQGGTFVVPGYGRICDQSDVVEYRDMLVIIRDVVKDMMQRGMTLEQIEAAAPAKPYAQEFGSEPGPSSTNAFIEAVYKSLAAKK
jgi:cyclase